MTKFKRFQSGYYDVSMCTLLYREYPERGTLRREEEANSAFSPGDIFYRDTDHGNFEFYINI